MTVCFWPSCKPDCKVPCTERHIHVKRLADKLTEEQKKVPHEQEG